MSLLEDFAVACHSRSAPFQTFRLFESPKHAPQPSGLLWIRERLWRASTNDSASWPYHREGAQERAEAKEGPPILMPRRINRPAPSTCGIVFPQPFDKVDPMGSVIITREGI